MKLGLSGAVEVPDHPSGEQDDTLEPPGHYRLDEPAAARVDVPRGPHGSRVPVWTRARTWQLVSAGLALLAFISLVSVRRAPLPEPPRVVRFSLAPPEGSSVEDFVISPDGREVAFTATDAEGRTTLWVRPLSQPEARQLARTDGAAMPFWSPDSRQIAFFSDGRLRSIATDGGMAVTLAEMPGEARGGTWGTDGGIIVAVAGQGVLRVPQAGGSPALLLPDHDGLAAPAWPAFLPDSRWFLFSAIGPDTGQPAVVAGLETGEVQIIEERATFGVFSDGFLVFCRDGLLMARPFDPERLAPTGEPVAIRYADMVATPDGRRPDLSAGRGVLAFRRGASTSSNLVWVDRNGRMTPVAESVAHDGFALSPDGTRIAVTRPARAGDDADLFVTDLGRGTTTRLSFDARGVRSPVWSPDGRRVATVSTEGTSATISLAAADGSAPEEVLFEGPAPLVLDDWSADGQFLLYTAEDPRGGQAAIWMLAARGEPRPEPLVQGDVRYGQARFSPDMRWVAYVSSESGREEVFVRPFSGGDIRWMASVGGGARPDWSPDGRELYYLSPQRVLMAVPIRPVSDALQMTAPRRLFPTAGATAYQVAPDGSRFLAAVPPGSEATRPIQVVLDWTREVLR